MLHGEWAETSTQAATWSGFHLRNNKALKEFNCTCLLSWKAIPKATKTLFIQLISTTDKRCFFLFSHQWLEKWQSDSSKEYLGLFMGKVAGNANSDTGLEISGLSNNFMTWKMLQPTCYCLAAACSNRCCIWNNWSQHCVPGGRVIPAAFKLERIAAMDELYNYDLTFRDKAEVFCYRIVEVSTTNVLGSFLLFL